MKKSLQKKIIETITTKAIKCNSIFDLQEIQSYIPDELNCKRVDKIPEKLAEDVAGRCIHMKEYTRMFDITYSSVHYWKKQGLEIVNASEILPPSKDVITIITENYDDVDVELMQIELEKLLKKRVKIIKGKKPKNIHRLKVIEVTEGDYDTSIGRFITLYELYEIKKNTYYSDLKGYCKFY